MSLRVPMFRLDAFPVEERNQIKVVAHLLSTMSNCVHYFERAVELVEFCSSKLPTATLEMGHDEFAERLKYYDWRLMAGKIAAIEIYNHQESKQAIDNNLSNCPSLAEKLDRKARGRACEIFDAAFPGYANVRLSVAHTSHTNTPEKMERQSIPGLGLFIGIAMNESVVTSFAEGKGKNRGGEVPVNRHGLKQLTLATEAYFACFAASAA